MTQQHWTEIKELLEQALELPAESRRGFFESRCMPEPVRSEAARVFAAMDEDDGFLEAPPRIAAEEVLGFARGSEPQFSAGDVLARRFRITRFLGRGGMGEVYEACDLESATQVAIKVIASSLSGDAAMLERFRREMILARAVTHRNVCRIFDLHHVDPGDGREITFLTMELVAGETLAEYLEHSGPLSGREAGNVLRQVAAGVAAAHEAGVIHGDLKPSNVMLSRPRTDGAVRAVVMDFGLATAAGAAEQAGLRAGTPEYMAPELENGQRSTAASDVYAFGLLVSRALTGKRLQTGANAKPDAVWAPLVQRCLQTDPAKRYADGSAIVRALDSRSRRTRVLWTALAAAAAVAAAFAAWTTMQRTYEPPAPAIAVLGFTNSSADPRADYFSLLLSLALDEELTATGKLRVVPASEVARAKSGVALRDEKNPAPELLSWLRSSLGADLVVHGSYETSANTGEPLRLRVDIKDVASGKLLASIEESGSESDLPALFARTGSDVRRLLRLGPVPAARQQGARAGLPGSLEAMRLYAEGLRNLQSFDTLAARDLLERAVAAEPSYALAHSALASAWEALGYEERARAEARKALDLKAPLLPEDRLLLEGSCWEALQQPEKAALAYRTLLQRGPTNPDYLLLLAHVQTGQEMRDTIASLRRLPPPVRNDGRIDLAEADGARRADLYTLERASAQRAAQKARAAGATLLTAEADLLDAWASWILGQPRAAEEAYRDAQELFSRAGDRNGAGRAMRGVALIAQYDGDMARASQLYAQALATFREIGSQQQTAVTLNGMAMIASNRGRLSEALRLYGDSLNVCAEVRSPICSGTELNNIGYVLFKTGRPEDARRRLEEAAAAFEEGKGRYGESFVLSSVGDIDAAQGRFAQAERELESSLRLSRQLGDRSSEASTTVGLGYLRMYERKPREAASLSHQAIQVERMLDERDNVAKGRLLLGYADLSLTKPKDAETELLAAVNDLNSAGRNDDAAIGDALLANALAAQGRFADARSAETLAKGTLGSSENELARILVLAAVARAEKLSGDAASSARMFDMAGKEALRCGFAGLSEAAAGH